MVFKIDNVRIRLGYERIVKKINLRSIETNLNHIEKMALSFRTRDHLHETLMRKIEKAREKLKGLQPHRQKRGLINALGTAVKYIAGNPDHEDLEIIHQSLETLQDHENKLTGNQIKQIKINTNFQSRINNVTETLRKISSQISLINNTLREDTTLEHINLIFNTDVLIHALEDIEEQVEFSKQDLLNKNILSFEDKKYIFQRLIQQNMDLTAIDEIFQFSAGSLSISKDNIIILVKIPILDENPYDLLQLQAVNINQTKIDTDIQLVAKRQNRILPQQRICKICEETKPLEDDCIYRILTHQKPKCSMKKTEQKTCIKEIMRGIVLVDTNTNLEVFSSCGDSRMVAEPTVIETENCTINILNYTFHKEEQFAPREEYIVPTYNRKPEIIDNLDEQIEDINIDNLEYLKEIQLTTQLYQRTTIIGGTTIIVTIIIISLLFLTVILRKMKDNQVKITTEKPLDDSEKADDDTCEGNLKPIRFAKLPVTSSPVSRPRTVNNLRGEELWNTLLGRPATLTGTDSTISKPEST